MKAERLMQATKGRKVTNGNGAADLSGLTQHWEGGTESAVFNALEAIARSPEPRTPVLGAQITRALSPKVVRDDVSTVCGLP